MKISGAIFRPEAVRHQQHRGCSKMSSSKATAMFARGAYWYDMSTEQGRERCWRLFSTDPTEKTFMALIEGGFVKSQLTGSPRAQ